MIQHAIVQQSETRYAEHEVERTRNLAKIAAGEVADTDARFRQRLARLSMAQGAGAALAEAEGAPAPSAPAASPIADVVALERVIGHSDLVGISYLELGLAVARSVGRVRVRTATGQTVAYGTGFMVSPRLLITNNHVLGSAEEAATSQVEFNLQDGVDGRPAVSEVFDLEPAVFFATDARLDYALVAVAERGRDGGELRALGYSRLIEQQGKVVLGEYVTIIQHPNGEPKQLALRENQLIDLLDDFLHYRTDTAPGSSGAPVFNDQWEVVGLHHSGVPKRDAKGQILARDGNVWTEGMGEHRIDWIANEGARVSRIVHHVKSLPLDGEAARLREEMFAAEPTPNPGIQVGGQNPGRQVGHDRDPAPAAAAAASGPTLGRDGSVTWTVPLQVSVRLGPGSIPSALPGTASASRGAAEERDLAEALAEAEAARSRPYYDPAADTADRDAFYAELAPTLTPAERFDALRGLVQRTHTRVRPYRPIVEVYPWVDLHPDRKLRSIYSGKTYEPEQLIREDVAVEAMRAQLRARSAPESTAGGQLSDEALAQLEAALPYNCEHVVPQSWFGEQQPMRGDLHHLFACGSRCNSFRGNTPYFDFADFGEAEQSECGRRIGKKFEPEQGKGPVARATLYFLLRYPGEVDDPANEYDASRLDTLLTWHADHPVDEYERHRNAAIFARQGNRNPLIDFPEWAALIDFRRGLG